MKLKSTFLLLLLCSFLNGFSQYVVVKARYTETRLVDDLPNDPKRENRLILSFYNVDAVGNYIPVSVTNYDMYVYDIGLQFGNFSGGVLDSTGNNYPGYAYTAPKVVSYFNTYGINYIDCNPTIAIHYVANGHELDCGWITVSYWSDDFADGHYFEHFTAPNICLPYFDFGHPYYFTPGNLNFDQTWTAGPPYNLYNFLCAGSSLQLVRRGLLLQDTSSVIFIALPVRFANVSGTINTADIATISFSNMTENDVLRYEVERSADGFNFSLIGTILPSSNTSGRADYHFSLLQPDVVNYYRVKALENNGTVFYSTVIPLTKINKPAAFSVYPNPVTNGLLTIRLSNAEAGRYILSVISASHQFLRQKLINHTAGDLVYSYDLTGLPRGVYQLVLQSATQRYSQKVIYVY